MLIYSVLLWGTLHQSPLPFVSSRVDDTVGILTCPFSPRKSESGVLTYLASQVSCFGSHCPVSSSVASLHTFSPHGWCNTWSADRCPCVMSQPESASLWSGSLLAFMLSEILILCGILYTDIVFYYLRLGAKPHPELPATFL